MKFFFTFDFWLLVHIGVRLGEKPKTLICTDNFLEFMCFRLEKTGKN